MGNEIRFQQILGIRFIVAEARETIDLILSGGGLVVGPAAPALTALATDRLYRDALLSADFAIPDSALMVLLWNLLQRDRINKLSGLKYLRLLIQHPSFREPGSTFWVMPSPKSADRNIAWLNTKGLHVTRENAYLAPFYGKTMQDPELLRTLEERRPRNVVLCLGGGTQEPLGHYLQQNLSYKPAIHCIGAAIAFLSGDQVRIPIAVDACGLGWLWRSLARPLRYCPRYWEARLLVPLMMRYRDRLPALVA